MNRIITRYLAGEMLKSSAATVLILFCILMSNALGRLLADIADGEIPRQALWPVMLSQSVNMLALLLPIGVFLGIIFALGRMYKDHEIVVMNACGIGYREFYLPVALILAPIFLFSVYSSLWLNAQMQRSAQSIIQQQEDLNEFQQIRPGQFNQSSDGEYVFFMESLSADKLALQGVIIGNSAGETMVLETAGSGRQRIDEKTGDLFLVVGPGQRFEGEAGKNNFKLIEFDQHGILIENKQPAVNKQLSSEEKTLTQLRASPLIEDRVELHWRLAVPVVLLVLGILAVPLSYITPRQGRFGKVAYALLVYIAYLNLLAITRARLESESFPMALNFWWVHALFLGLALLLLLRRNRSFVLRRKMVRT